LAGEKSEDAPTIGASTQSEDAPTKVRMISKLSLRFESVSFESKLVVLPWSILLILP
jgi:hypothetical protein